MKGSDKWGQGRGPRVEVVLAILLVVSAVGVYFFYLEGSGLISAGQSGRITTVSTTGVACDSADMPQVAQRVQNDPRFAALGGGLCFGYIGQEVSGGNSLLTFNYYNGTILYPCGTWPLEPVAIQIQAVVSSASATIESVKMSDQSNLNSPVSCGPEVPPVRVVSVQDVESTIPAVPQLNVTVAANAGVRPVVSLKASLTLNGGSQQFQLIAPPSVLAQGQTVSKTEIILSRLSFAGDEVYPMTISGAFEDGQAFSYLVHIQIAQVP